MHRLIHVAIRSWAQNLEWERTAQKLILQVFPILEINEASQEKHTRCRQLLPHAQRVLDLLGTPDAFSLMSVQLKFRIAAYLNLVNLAVELKQASDLLLSLVAPMKEFAERGITADFTEVDLEDRITRIYFAQGQQAIGIRRAKKCLDSRVGTFPADHPAIIHAKDLFALGLIAQGKCKEAEKQLNATHSLVAHRYGKTSFLALNLLDSLALAYEGQGRYQSAVDTIQEILDTWVPIYGERNECIIRCLGSMAGSLRLLYKIEEAGSLIRRTLAISEETLGMDHPLTLSTTTKYAFQLVSELNEPAAFLALERVWKSQQRVLGECAARTLITLGNMAMYHASPVASELLLKDAIEKSRKTYGLTGPTRFLQDNLARMYIFEQPIPFEEIEVYCRSLLEVQSKYPDPRG